MARPTKERRVEYIPEFDYFKPAGIPKKDLEEICLTIEEIEALRLKDLEGLMQVEAAERMEVSRPTFQRVLIEARRKVVKALIEGKAIRFEGGNYRLARKRYCKKCGREFKATFNKLGKNQQKNYCPDCD